MYYPYYGNAQIYNYSYQPVYWTYPNQVEHLDGNPYFEEKNILNDYGPNPYVVDIEKITKQNNNYRTALWTGSNLQVTLMSLQVGEDIGFEIHPDVDQFLRIEQGQGVVQMGTSKENLNFQRNVREDFAILIPAGTWHNVTNTGNEPLKLYSIYAPPNHPFGTVHISKADAIAEEIGRDKG